VAGRYVVEAFSPGQVVSITAGPPGQALTVKVDRPSLRPSSVTLDLTAGAAATGVDLFLESRPTEPEPPDAAAARSGSTIRGTVSTTAGTPLAGAMVSVSRSGSLPGSARSTITDTSGQFSVGGLGPGTFTVYASKRGYVRSEAGQRGGLLPGLPLRIEAAKDVDDLSIVLPLSGVVEGTVTDEHGEAVQEAAVQLLRVRREPNGTLAREQGAFRRQTDDRGQFRLSDVGPGDYIVMASLPGENVDPSAARRMAYVPAYYPDTPDFVNAAPIRIADGDVIGGLVLTMRRVPVARVSGAVVDSRGLPSTGAVRLTLQHAGTIAPEARTVQLGADGGFVFADVPPGDYVLRTAVPPGPAGSELATGLVTVTDRDPEPVLLRTSPGSTVSGRIVLEGGPGDLLWGYSATSVPAEPVSSPGRVSNSGPIATGEPFRLSALMGPTRLRVWTEDRNWYLKSILINGFDVVDTPFDFGFDGRAYADVEVVFSRAGASLTGRATDGRAAPVRDYAVYVFSLDRDRWFAGSRAVKLSRAAADGGFAVSSLPPGEYWVAAVDRLDVPDAADRVDTELLTRLTSRATRVTLGAGQSQSLTMRVLDR
jgi:hypothetical protein